MTRRSAARSPGAADRARQRTKRASVLRAARGALPHSDGAAAAAPPCLDGIPHYADAQRTSRAARYSSTCWCRRRRGRSEEARPRGDKNGEASMGVGSPSRRGGARCGDRGWLEALGGAGHYLYPVHISHTFISCPSVGAARDVLLLRTPRPPVRRRRARPNASRTRPSPPRRRARPRPRRRCGGPAPRRPRAAASASRSPRSGTPMYDALP